MKLLFDQNPSPNLVTRLANLFPDSTHVFFVGFDREDDRSIRKFAEENDYVIVTKEADYSDLNLLLGYPPKVIWIRRGNCSTETIERILRESSSDIEAMSADPDAAMITIY